VRRNVASLITIPEGQAGRPSQAMTLDQAVALLGVVGVRSEFRLSAYVVLSLLTGVRTEEARALHWTEGAVAELSRRRITATGSKSCGLELSSCCYKWHERWLGTR
jgi:hypothetical protein